jgi:Flp pilus assembly protein TadG
MNLFIASYGFLRAVLMAHAASLRTARAEGDRGASAVELAIITAVILVIAAVILAAIRAFVGKESNKIGGTSG